ncbi:SDR family NAD(P)-dependent oxidoreductase [Algibacillus agarilyticus]|uniref:SDR family NAD(P)-dependent oxidoreductase n=1 Tax=Algibacillus agarilyticus TaxID=2234133 RepID=UPI000DD01FD1|nr:SDR family NAD(P)-dependent oxidoreductase [Algibacillus agarilyticus]
MNLNLTNKVALITGASCGIGASIAESFLEEGAKVILVSRGSDKLYNLAHDLKVKFGENHVAVYKCDCSKVDELALLNRVISKEIGDIDIVVANVGDGKSVPDALPNLTQWSITWQKNFESSLFTVNEFLPVLRKTKGCILFISSIAGVEAFGAPVDYSTAKSAIVALSKNMARKLACESVRVNTVLPGNILFPDGSWDKKMADNPEKINSMIESTVPMNRFGAPAEVAGICTFLCSNKASFITGSSIVVDGGQTMGVY